MKTPQVTHMTSLLYSPLGGAANGATCFAEGLSPLEEPDAPLERLGGAFVSSPLPPLLQPLSSSVAFVLAAARAFALPLAFGFALPLAVAPLAANWTEPSSPSLLPCAVGGIYE